MLNSVIFYHSDNCKYTQGTRMDAHKDFDKHRGFNKVSEERMYTRIKFGRLLSVSVSLFFHTQRQACLWMEPLRVLGANLLWWKCHSTENLCTMTTVTFNRWDDLFSLWQIWHMIVLNLSQHKIDVQKKWAVTVEIKGMTGDTKNSKYLN